MEKPPLLREASMVSTFPALGSPFGSLRQPLLPRAGSARSDVAILLQQLQTIASVLRSDPTNGVDSALLVDFCIDATEMLSRHTHIVRSVLPREVVCPSPPRAAGTLLCPRVAAVCSAQCCPCLVLFVVVCGAGDPGGRIHAVFDPCVPSLWCSAW
jgi:hypothetical protein